MNMGCVYQVVRGAVFKEAHTFYERKTILLFVPLSISSVTFDIADKGISYSKSDKGSKMNTIKLKGFNACSLLTLQ
jgi:hypothetical protein